MITINVRSTLINRRISIGNNYIYPLRCFCKIRRHIQNGKQLRFQSKFFKLIHSSIPDASRCSCNDVYRVRVSDDFFKASQLIRSLNKLHISSLVNPALYSVSRVLARSVNRRLNKHNKHQCRDFY